ncbi:MAG: glycogen/starch/alpha-glucan phosphorylase [Janthinobacterium lividum]
MDLATPDAPELLPPAGGPPNGPEGTERRAPPDPVLELRRRIVEHLTYQVGKDPQTAGERDWFVAIALATRDGVVDGWIACNREAVRSGVKRVYYLSLEFLVGRLLFDALGNLGILETARAALAGLGVDLDRVRLQEPDAGLGNGGLGRLAACFMESMATLRIAAYGYGIRYEHGLFRQTIEGGVQHELPDDWLAFGNPWEFERAEASYEVGFGGRVAAARGDGPQGARYAWEPAETISAVAYDTPVVGGGGGVATLRLWSARAKAKLRLEDFNRGDHVGALADRTRMEAISRVLYPGDESAAGQELRLRQEFFFASASLQDLVARHLAQFGDIASLPEKVAIQLNDTHPAIAVAEMMRILLDGHGMGWDEAWRITVACFSYTNHTLLPEALEMWPVPLMERLLPRHMQIIYLVNARHLDGLREAGRGQEGFVAAMSLIDEQHGRRVRMGHLAFLGSHKINGVSALHTDLMRRTVFNDLHSIMPDRITNKTNGITFRRWLHYANPGLTGLLVETLGERVLKDPEALLGLEAFAEDASFQERYAAERHGRKAAMMRTVSDQLGLTLDPDAIFDVQIKRLHEYKRQLLNILHTIGLYDSIRSRSTHDWVPRVKIFAGKAAPGYHQAKLIIRLAHDVAEVVNNDPTVRDLLKVVFLPNYSVSLAETIIPAADLSEQISTAGMEASGTGNMKLALNGALTIGTLDGANVEIRERVGADNIFIFGMTAAEVQARQAGGYDAHAAVAASPALAEVLEAVRNGAFSPHEPHRYRALVDGLLANDRFFVMADFDAYYDSHRQVATRWQDKRAWWRSAILNTARIGWFSSDRTIREYAEEIWDVPVG